MVLKLTLFDLDVQGNLALESINASRAITTRRLDPEWPYLYQKMYHGKVKEYIVKIMLFDCDLWCLFGLS